MSRLFALCMTLLIAVLILYGTLRPPGGGGPGLLTDKQMHALAFGVLVLPLSIASPASVFRIAAVALAFGAVIELIQPGFNRSAEWGDLLADAIGILIGIVPGLWLRRRQIQRIRSV